jgi:hypothetical protein
LPKRKPYKNDPAILERWISLRAAGWTYERIAQNEGVTTSTISGALDYYRRNNQHEEFTIDFGEPWTLAGDWVIIGDVHAPCVDYDFAKLVLVIARKCGIKRLLVAGDMFNFDGFSSYAVNIPPISWHQDRDAARVLIHDWLEWFDEIRFLMGNHDRRLSKWTNGELDESDIFGMVIASDKVFHSNWGWCTIDNGGQVWRVTHARNYSRNQLVVQSDLAHKFQQNIISNHSHHLAKGWDKFGRYVIVENGGLFDPSKLAYAVMDDSNMPAMINGFSVLQNGAVEVYGKAPFTDWTTVLI